MSYFLAEPIVLQPPDCPRMSHKLPRCRGSEPGCNFSLLLVLRSLNGCSLSLGVIQILVLIDQNPSRLPARLPEQINARAGPTRKLADPFCELLCVLQHR